jgi:hypothetical protein
MAMAGTLLTGGMPLNHAELTLREYKQTSLFGHKNSGIKDPRSWCVRRVRLVPASLWTHAAHVQQNMTPFKRGGSSKGVII